MTETVGIAGDRIRSFVERIEHIEEEIKALNEGKKEIFAEAKGDGFDVKVLKEIIRLRKQDKDERDEHESLLDLYLRAMETPDAERAKGAVLAIAFADSAPARILASAVARVSESTRCA